MATRRWHQDRGKALTQARKLISQLVRDRVDAARLIAAKDYSYSSDSKEKWAYAQALLLEDFHQRVLKRLDAYLEAVEAEPLIDEMADILDL